MFEATDVYIIFVFNKIKPSICGCTMRKKIVKIGLDLKKKIFKDGMSLAKGFI